MENAEEVLQCLDEFSKVKPKDIPRELEEYLCFVAKTGDPVYQWSLIKCLFREKLINVITEFYESCPSVEIPPCPNVEAFNYDVMKSFILEKLESFVAAPFTVQRICELLTTPRKEYNRIDKYMRALEKNILVVSTREPGQRRSAENGESILNGLESETQTNTISNEIHIDVDMEEAPVWSPKADISEVNSLDTTKTVFSPSPTTVSDVMKPITEMTYATHDLALNGPLHSEAEAVATVESVIACSSSSDVAAVVCETDIVVEQTYISNISISSTEPFNNHEDKPEDVVVVKQASDEQIEPVTLADAVIINRDFTMTIDEPTKPDSELAEETPIPVDIKPIVECSDLTPTVESSDFMEATPIAIPSEAESESPLLKVPSPISEEPNTSTDADSTMAKEEISLVPDEVCSVETSEAKCTEEVETPFEKSPEPSKPFDDLVQEQPSVISSTLDLVPDKVPSPVAEMSKDIFKEIEIAKEVVEQIEEADSNVEISSTKSETDSVTITEELSQEDEVVDSVEEKTDVAESLHEISNDGDTKQ